MPKRKMNYTELEDLLYKAYDLYVENLRIFVILKSGKMTVNIFIPGRLSSERCPNKLLSPIGDTCLWEIACSKLESIPFGTYALTCDKPLIDIAESYNVEVIVRDKETSLADSPSRFVFKDIDQLPASHAMLLNPCFAFLRPETVTDILTDFESNGYDYATSVKPFINYLFDEQGTPVTPIDYTDINTKAIKPLFQMAHCFHIFNKAEFFETGYMLQPGHQTYMIEGIETVDVDTKEELEYVRYLWGTK